MKMSITVTFSKIVALLVLGGAIWLDVKTGTGATAFMFALPFVVVLITGKQWIDNKKQKSWQKEHQKETDQEKEQEVTEAGEVVHLPNQPEIQRDED